MTTVHTEFGPGEIIASETVRGRTQHKVAVNGNEIWVDEAKLGITRVADAFAWQPPSHHPDAPSDSFSHLGDEDPYYEPSHLEDDPHHDALMRDVDEYGYGSGEGFDGGRAGEIFNNAPHSFGRGAEDASMDAHRLGWAPVDHDNSVNLPYDPTPQYPAIPGDTESTLQPIHEIDADERLSPADSITFEDRDEQEGGEGVGMFADNFEKAAGFYDDYHGEDGPGDRFDRHPQTGLPQRPGFDEVEGYGQAGHPGYGGPLGPEHSLVNTEAYQNYQPGLNPYEGSRHEAFGPLMVALPAVAEAIGGGGAAGVAGGVARGVGMGAASDMMGGGDQQQVDENGNPVTDAGDKAMEFAQPGPGWQLPASRMDSWLDSRRNVRAAHEAHNLSDHYIEIDASADYHNDPVAQFRHDPSAYISRLGHVENDPVSMEMEHYGQLVEADANIREAAWSDVRQKAMRLRREGRVHVKDVAPDRIYASVDGDHGTYDVMIAKGGAFGGFGGGHSISNWRCACEWGRWAFKRQLTYVGRLCSHGYAAYMEMQSSHVKGQPRQQRLTRPYKKADALQSVPQRLVPELIINDSDDARQFLDVEKDERKDTGPDDVVSEENIVHFARVLTACDQNNWPYPRELVAFLERLGDDQTKEDWKIEDAGEAAGSALNEIRDWADTPQSEDLGHMEERIDDIQDAVQKARDGGTDADQLVAFRTAAPGQNSVLNDWTGISDDNNNGRPAPAPRGTRTETTPSDALSNAAADAEDYAADVGRGPRSTTTTTTPSDPAANVAADNADYGPDAGRGGGGGGGGTAQPLVDLMNGRPGAGDAGGAPGGAKGVTERTPGDIAAQGYRGDPGAANAPKGGTQGGDDPALPGGQSYNKSTNDAGTWQKNETQDPIGQGKYEIQQGDTLADIAQRSGYGGDYSSLAQQNNIADPNKINAGDPLNIGKPGGGGAQAPGQPGGGGATPPPTATDNPASNAAGGPLNQNSGGLGADNPAAPAASAAAPAGPAAPATPTTPDLSAIGGSASSAGGGVNTDVASGAPPAPAAPAATPPTPGDTSSANAGAGGATSDTGTPGAIGSGGSQDVASQLGNVMGPVSDAISSFTGLLGSRSIFADQADYDEWQRYAYPDAKFHDHKPFNGSGAVEPLEYSTSEEYADKARKGMDDVTDLEDHNVKEGEPRTSGIKRAGRGATRHVVPTVVREQHIKGQGNHQTVEAAMESYGNFDPLAAKRPEDFDDDAAAQHIAANTDGDIVAAFQRQADNGGSALTAAAGGNDNFDIASAAAGFLQKTAGRNYSLAEQAELIREGDIGGAGNLGSLQLAGTHYEDESKNSVGLW